MKKLMIGLLVCILSIITIAGSVGIVAYIELPPRPGSVEGTSVAYIELPPRPGSVEGTSVAYIELPPRPGSVEI